MLRFTYRHRGRRRWAGHDFALQGAVAEQADDQLV
jgi:hypothetical protein